METKLDQVLTEIQTTTSKIRRPYINLSPIEFKKQWQDIFLALEGVEYEIDANNKNVINQIYYYLTGSEKFKGDHNKGLMITGGYGTGKTRIMKIIKYIVQANADRIIHFLSCPNLIEESKGKTIDYYFKRPLILDELGREVKTVKDYGTERQPIIEILTQRYDYKSWTLVTSNYKPSNLGDKYGGYILDRFNEMFNFLELKGESRRS